MPALLQQTETASLKWNDYWAADSFWAGSKLWQINARLFFEGVKSFLPLSSKDVVLDIGCGPGDAARLLAPQVKKVIAADRSPRMIELAAKNFETLPNAEAQLLAGNLQDILRTEKPTVILCVSVLQYFESHAAIEDWIENIRAAAQPGSKLLLADLPLERTFFGTFWDSIASIVQSIRGGYFPEYFKTSLQLMDPRNPYRHFSSQNTTLSFSESWIQALTVKLNLQAVILKKSLSLCAHRPSLLIQL